MSAQVLFERHDRVGLITLNRPEKLNAFADRMRDELAEVTRAAAEDEAVGALVLTGAGRAFCAGADIGYMHDLVSRQEWDTLEALVKAGANVNIPDRNGTTPLGLAKGRGYAAMVKILEAAGAR